jgi:hypothetical protein
MKKALFSMALVVGLLSLSGCEEMMGGDWIVDWTPVNILIEAVDADNHSIISPEMPGMSLTFKGETYTVKGVEGQTRAYLAVMHGLLAVPQYEVNGETVYHLVFGEIDGAADMDEDITLVWPDGSKDVIYYHCSDHKEGRNPKCNRSWKLNGEKHEGGTFRFSGKTLPD